MAVCISVQNTFKRRYMKMIETAYPKFRIRLDCALFCLLKIFIFGLMSAHKHFVSHSIFSHLKTY